MNNYKSILKSLYLNTFFYIIKLFLFFYETNQRENKLLIVKLDAIGDYVLFRNFIKIIKESEKYKDFEITFVGNINVQSISEWLDGKYIDQFVWIDKKKIFKNPFYLIRLLTKIGCRFNTALQPTYSRELLGDYLIKFSKAKTKITFAGDTNNLKQEDKNHTDKWYTNLIKLNDDTVFDFSKNKEFFEIVIEETINLNLPLIDKSEIESINWPENLTQPLKYAILFPGASAAKRRWPTSKFAEIANYIKNNYHLDIIICGSKNDTVIAQEIIKKANPDIIDATGKTNLKELVLLIAQASILITNDTSAAHIGPAISIQTIALSQYNHYGRFLPYPHQEGLHNICITPELYSPLSFSDKCQKFALGSDVDINLIETSQVTKAIQQILS